jgi:hypothetical protein
VRGTGRLECFQKDSTVWRHRTTPWKAIKVGFGPAKALKPEGGPMHAKEPLRFIG